MKKNLFTKIAAGALSAALSVTMLAGCGNKKTAATDDQGRTIISIGAWPVKEGKALDDANAKKERFEKANPDVVIQPDNWSFDLKSFYAKAAGGQLPTDFPIKLYRGASGHRGKLCGGLDGVLEKTRV